MFDYIINSLKNMFKHDQKKVSPSLNIIEYTFENEVLDNTKFNNSQFVLDTSVEDTQPVLDTSVEDTQPVLDTVDDDTQPVLDTSVEDTQPVLDT